MFCFVFLTNRNCKREVEDISPAIIYSHRPSTPYLGYTFTPSTDNTYTCVCIYHTLFPIPSSLIKLQPCAIAQNQNSVIYCLIFRFWWMSSVLAPSCSIEYSTEGRYAWHPGSRLPVLPAGALYGPDIHLQGLPVLTPAGPGNHCEEGRPQWHARG